MKSNPFRIPSDNSHRIVLHQPDRRGTDFERLEDMAVAELPYELFKPLEFHERVLRDAVKHPSVWTGFRGLRDSIALPLVLSGLRNQLMAPEAYETFRDRFRQRLRESQGAAEDKLRLHVARVLEL
jgi:hypothetical protein